MGGNYTSMATYGRTHANVPPVGCLFSPRIMIYRHVQMGLLGPEIQMQWRITQAVQGDWLQVDSPSKVADVVLQWLVEVLWW